MQEAIISAPTTLIIEETVTMDIHFINATIHCFPGATVHNILDKLVDLLALPPTSIKRTVLHEVDQWDDDRVFKHKSKKRDI